MDFAEILTKNPIIAGFLLLTAIVGSVIGAVSWLDGRLDSKIKEQARLQEPGTAKHVEAAVPVGAVVAFDLPDGCPKGWIRFESAGGRSIVGVGNRGVIFPGETVVEYNSQITDPKKHANLF